MVIEMQRSFGCEGALFYCGLTAIGARVVRFFETRDYSVAAFGVSGAITATNTVLPSLMAVPTQRPESR